MENKNRNEIFENYPVKKAVLSLALPTMMGMLITVLYNMVDTIFVGQTGDPNQIAAITLVNPIFIILLAVGNIFGIGGGTYIARLLGQKKLDEVKEVSSFCVYLGGAISIISGGIILLFIEKILVVLGTSAQTYNFSKNYIGILGIGAIFICLQIILSAIIRSEGASKVSMNGLIIGTVLNIILDPIMIFTFKMGVVGAALATVIGSAISVIYFLLYFFNKKYNTSLSVSIKNLKFKLSTLKTILLIGIPLSLSNLLISFSTAVLNNFAAAYGDDVVAAIGISSRISTVAILLFVGLCQGTQPLIAYNNAAKNYTRMNSIIRFSIILSISMGVVFLVSSLILGEQMVKIFINNSPEIVKQATYFLKATMSSAPLLGVLYLFIFTFQAFGKTVIALSLPFFRQCILFMPIIFIGNKLFGLNGIIWAQPIADIFSAIISVILYINIYKKLIKERN